MFQLFEKGFSILALLFYADAIFSLLRREGLPVGAIAKLLYYGIPFINLLLLGIHWRKVIPIVVKEKLWWCLFGFALISIFWSAAPTVTLKQLQALIRVTLLGVYLGTNFNLKQQLQIYTWAFGIAGLLSLCFGLVLPQYGVMGMGKTLDPENLNHMGAWQGIFSHKNSFGRVMTLSTVVFALSVMNRRLRLYQIGWLGILLSLLMILKSTSKSSLLITLTLLVLIPLFRALRWNYSVVLPLLITLITTVGGLGAIFLENIEPILGAIGKDLTLTGRTDLWHAVWVSIQERPWLGYGYGGFWLKLAGDSEVIWQELKWAVPHSHNGLIDITLDLGYVGLFLFLCTFIVTYLKAFHWVRSVRNVEGLFPLVYLTFILLFNFTESSFFRQGFIVVIYIATVLSMHNHRQNLVPFMHQLWPSAKPQQLPLLPSLRAKR